MMTEYEFYEWYVQTDTEDLVNRAYKNYVKALRFDALINYGVDNWDGYEDAMQSLDDEISNDD